MPYLNLVYSGSTQDKLMSFSTAKVQQSLERKEHGYFRRKHADAVKVSSQVCDEFTKHATCLCDEEGALWI